MTYDLDRCRAERDYAQAEVSRLKDTVAKQNIEIWDLKARLSPAPVSEEEIADAISKSIGIAWTRSGEKIEGINNAARAILSLLSDAQGVPAILPCDVRLPPATTISKGCPIDALWTALRVRRDHPFDASSDGEGHVPSTLAAELSASPSESESSSRRGGPSPASGAVPQTDQETIERLFHSIGELVECCERDFTDEDTEDGDFRFEDDEKVAYPEGPELEKSVLTFGAIRHARDALDVLREVYASAIAAAPQPPAEDGWRDIETAPKDGTRFWGRVDDDAIAMLWHAGFGAFVSSWRQISLAPGYTYYDGTTTRDHSPVTHHPTQWRPLPAPPQPGGKS